MHACVRACMHAYGLAPSPLALSYVPWPCPMSADRQKRGPFRLRNEPMHACMHASVRACMHASMLACMHACVHVQLMSS